MATAPSRPPARTPVKRLKFAFPFRKASSDPRKPPSAFTDQHEFLSLLRKESLGAYAVSRKGLWHGGIHVSEAGAGASFDLKHGVRCMADGEVVAWRVNRNYLKCELPAFSAQYSTGFALVRHVMEFPKDCTLTFHSLYMHLQDLAGYEADKMLPTPAYWTTWYKVTSGAKNRQAGGSARSGSPAAQVGLHVLATKPGGTILGILPHGTQFSVLKREGDWAQIDAVHVGSMVPPKVGAYVEPTAAHKGWVFLGKDGSAAVVEAFVPATAVDRVVVPPKPVPIKAGALIGHLGRDDSLAEKHVARGVHLEMFCDNSIRSFIDKGRSWVAENAAKPKAWEQLGLSTAPTILRIDRQTKLYKKPNQEGRDAPETDVVRAYTLAELERRTDKPFTETDKGTDGKKLRWWKVESSDVRRQDISGWVREENFPGGRISREFPQKWVDFELLDAAHDQTHTIFATTAGYLDYITGADVPNPGARDKLSPLMRMACQHLYKRGDGLQAANDLCVASRDPWTAVGASRLIFRHESEWANPEKWTPLIAELEKISRNREALAAEHERIQALTWWADVKAHYPALPDPKVFHIHPIGMVGNHIGGDFMACTHCGANLAITPEILIRLFPRINIHNSEGYAKELTRIISEFRIDNCHRLAHFLGQCEVECSGFTAFKEDLYYKDGDYLWSTYRTALKGGLGRLHPTWSLDEMERHAKLKLVRNDAELGRVLFGDGEYPDVDFRGRGLLHLTWKENYAAYTAARGVDVLADPSVVRNDRYVSADTGAWYWSNKGINEIADKNNIKGVTKKINPALKGFSQRKNAAIRAFAILNKGMDPCKQRWDSSLVPEYGW